MSSTKIGMVSGSISMTSRTADQLITMGSGDAALLFLYLLRTGGQYDPARACKALNWDGTRLNNAFSDLESHQLIKGVAVESAPVISRKDAPQYTAADIAGELENPTSTFPGLLRGVENLLGKTLSPRELNELMTLYDHMALPAEVIYLLVNHMVEETEFRQGAGRKPRMSQILKQGELWVSKGLDTLETATAYVDKLHYFRTQEGEIMAMLGYRNRRANSEERKFINAWLTMGFPLDVIQKASEKTVLNTGSWNWKYCNGILSSWHKNNLHTLEEIAAAEGDSPVIPKVNPEKKPAPRPQRPAVGGKRASDDATKAAQQEAILRMQKFLREQQGGNQ